MNNSEKFILDGPAYRPGDEPEEIKNAIQTLKDELTAAFPDRCVIQEKWNHSRWDKLAGYLVHSLNYKNGTAFLRSYGFRVFTTQKEHDEWENDLENLSSKIWDIFEK